MDKKEIKTALRNIESALTNVEKKKFKLFFFVTDTKGVPVGSLAYMYQLAYALKELDYDVRILHAEKDFVGVKDWLGEKYANLPHFDSQKDNIDVSPADFLFIEELLPNIMAKTKELPCKRIVVIENSNYLIDTIQLGSSLEALGIRDCVTTSKSMEKRLLELFPYLKTYVVRPTIDEVFAPSEKSKIIVNVIAKNETDINSVINPFKWRFPIYDFVTFRFIKGRSHQEEAAYLKEGAISVWINDKTDFGYTPLEAMACGNIIIGKIPENEPEWMIDSNRELIDNGVWFYKMKDLPRILANVIQTVLYDKVPEGLYENMKETLSYYTSKKQSKELEKVAQEIFDTRHKELKIMADALKNNLEEQETKK